MDSSIDESKSLLSRLFSWLGACFSLFEKWSPESSLDNASCEQLQNPACENDSNLITIGSHPALVTVQDRISKHRFTVDTGSVVSIFPAMEEDRRVPSWPDEQVNLSSGAEERLRTYGERKIKVDLATGRDYTWTFVLADAAILGKDFLEHFHLVVDVKNCLVVDQSSHFCNGLETDEEGFCPGEKCPRPVENFLLVPGRRPQSRERTHEVEDGYDYALLVDTGATASVVRATQDEISSCLCPAVGKTLGRTVNCFGFRQIDVEVTCPGKPSITIPWTFHTSDGMNLAPALLGCDFLRETGLRVDMRNRTLLPPVEIDGTSLRRSSFPVVSTST